LASQSWPLTEFFSRQQTVAAAEKKDGLSRPNEKRRHETKNSLSATQLLNSTKILFRQQKSLATNKKKQLGHNKNSFFGNKNPWQQTKKNNSATTKILFRQHKSLATNKKKQLGHNKNSFSATKILGNKQKKTTRPQQKFFLVRKTWPTLSARTGWDFEIYIGKNNGERGQEGTAVKIREAKKGFHRMATAAART